MKINLGSGTQTPSGWVNVDYAVGARLMKNPLFRALNRRFRFFNIDWDSSILIHDLTRNFPWQDNTISIIYSSHFLEHLTREQGLAFLRECERVLRPGGVIRIVVPDLRILIDAYDRGDFKADEFVEKLGVLPIPSGRWLKDRLAPFVQVPHKCMYDSRTLLKVMSGVGFSANPRNPFESEIHEIEEIEWKSRTENSVIVEGKKLNNKNKF